MLRDARAVLVLSLGLALGAACGSPGPETPDPSALQVGGSYQITPAVVQNPCGNVTVLPGPAQVTHTAGSADLRLSHAGQTYTGRVERSGAFTTSALVISVGGGSTDTVRIEGRFTTSGFEATVTVDTAHAGAAPCRYVVGWQAGKQGAPNVIPG
jgi:hypothetical protein